MRYERSLAIASRHSRIIELIRTGDFSSRDLARKLMVSEQTVYRDIEFLKSRGYAIRSEKHTERWAYHLRSEPTAAATNPKGGFA
jgi:DeoR/GlpR family transcriptional regulator of sugar metabolism